MRRFPASLVFCFVTLWLPPAKVVGQAVRPLPEIPHAEQEKQRKDRAAWLKTQVLDPYETIGKKNPKWDDAVRSALQAAIRKWAIESYQGDEQEALLEGLRSAIKAGCNDPYVRYLHIVFCPEAVRGPTPWVMTGYGMKDCQYPIRARLLALTTAADTLASEAKLGDGDRKSAVMFWDTALALLPDLIKDKSAHAGSDKYMICSRLLETGTRLYGDRKVVYERIAAKLGNDQKDQLDLLLLRAMFLTEYAWDARGRGFANTVTAEGRQLMLARLADAEKALEEAWKLDPRNPHVPSHMLTVELGQGRGRDRMELWFERAMKNGGSFYAIPSKMTYLEPKWYGGDKEMLEFGQQLLASKNWAAMTPFYLLNVHAVLANYRGEKREEYYLQPHVWKDTKALFDGYLEFRPDSNWARSLYARQAIRCGQGKEALNQLDLLKDKYSKIVFPDEKEFAELNAKAKKLAEGK